MNILIENIPQEIEAKILGLGITVGSIAGTSPNAKAFRSSLPTGLCARTLYDIVREGEVLKGTRVTTIRAIARWCGFERVII